MTAISVGSHDDDLYHRHHIHRHDQDHDQIHDLVVMPVMIKTELAVEVARTVVMAMLAIAIMMSGPWRHGSRRFGHHVEGYDVRASGSDDDRDGKEHDPESENGTADSKSQRSGHDGCDGDAVM